MFAMAFAKTQSLYLPIGLHFGWDLRNNVVFSQGLAGHQWLVSVDGEKLGIVLSALVFLMQVFAVPLAVYWYLQRIGHHMKANPGIAILHSAREQVCRVVPATRPSGR